MIDFRSRSGVVALLAWPVEYDDTGVMSFMISHDDQLYEKDLGAETDQVARSITRYDPDSSWRKADPDE